MRIGQAVGHGVLLAICSLISYTSITYQLIAGRIVPRDDEFLGGMWAVIATIFVFRYSYQESVTAALSRVPRSGNYLLYWMASQAVWSADPREAKGPDATFAYDWNPADVNRNNTMLTAGLRFNEPLPLHIHNTMPVGYVRNGFSPQFLPSGIPACKTEQDVEFNATLDVLQMLLLEPVIQYYSHVGGAAQQTVVFGFRTKVEF